ncbi:MAG: porin family protein [Aureispira sp.]|nr:porin family protein [Aureispira sp.]
MKKDFDAIDKMARDALSDLEVKFNPNDWDRMQDKLDGVDGIDNSFREALQGFTVAFNPADWSQMENKLDEIYVDQAVKNAVEGVEVPFNAAHWTMMENTLDEIYVDQSVKNSLQNFEATFNPKDWERMEEELDRKKHLYPHIWFYKSIEAVVMGLILFTIFNFITKPSNSTYHKANSTSTANSGIVSNSTNNNSDNTNNVSKEFQTNPNAMNNSNSDNSNSNANNNNNALASANNGMENTANGNIGNNNNSINNSLNGNANNANITNSNTTSNNNTVTNSNNNNRSSNIDNLQGANKNSNNRKVDNSNSSGSAKTNNSSNTNNGSKANSNSSNKTNTKNTAANGNEHNDQEQNNNATTVNKMDNTATANNVNNNNTIANSNNTSEVSTSSSNSNATTANNQDKNLANTSETTKKEHSLTFLKTIDASKTKLVEDPIFELKKLEIPEPYIRQLRVGGVFSPNLEMNTSEGKGGIGYTFGLTLEADLFKKVSFKTGLIYSQKNYTAQNQVIVDNTNADGSIHTVVVDKKTNLFILDIPVYLQYAFYQNEKWRVYATAGIDANLIVGKKYTGTEKVEYNGVNVSTEINSQDYDEGLFKGGKFLDNAYMTVGGGIGVERQLGDKVCLYLQPSYQHTITPLGVNKDRINTFSLSVGIKTNIR